MRYRVAALVLVALSLLSVQFAEAQQGKKVHVIGFLRSGSPTIHASENEAFRQGLRDLGYVEGKNIAFEYRYAEGKPERYPELAAELVRHKVDVIVVGGTGPTRAARQATSTIPIVVGAAGDLVRAGLVASLARPGGNITGSTEISPDLSGKRLELLKEVVPNASQVAVVWYPSVGSTDDDEVRETDTAARQFGVKIHLVEVRTPGDFQAAFAAMTKQQANAVIIIQGAFTLFHRKQLVEHAVKNRLPSLCESARFGEEGCLINYGADVLYLYRRAASYVDKILKGTKPADLPIEQPTKFELIINLKTAKHIGLTITPSVLARADRVIR
jgi:putative tryptophan/tyrosine transport system substrate-binding protein